MSKQDIKTLSFEQAYAQLEDTVQKLEGGNLSLEETIALYQAGMSLAKRCSQQLDEAELSIKRLTPSGEMVEFEDI